MAKKSSLKKLAESATKNSNEITLIIEAAGLVVAAATALLETAQPILENVDTEALASKAKNGITIVAENAGKAGKAATEAVSNIFSKLGNNKDDIIKDLSKTSDEKELRQAIKEARQTVLENAAPAMTVADFVKAQEKAGEEEIGPVSDMPGCFVIATYKKLDFDKDLTDYTGVYVGRADNTAEGLKLAISKDGNADVYADVKYKQNVHVYIFNCLPENLDERYISLTQTFAGERSYN